MALQRSLLRALAVAAALGIGGAASAEPIQVEYFVAQKPFKKAATNTSVLDFRLFEDANCTVEIGSFPIFAGDQYAHFFVDKTQKLRGAPRKPKAVRIRAVIDAPTTLSAPYLLVEGPGIVPIDDPCQLQSGDPIAAVGPTGAQGETGSAGPQGEMGPQGPQGDVGPMGPAGADGATGPQGAQGEVGPMGPAGADGAVGAQGEVGPMGPAGTDGATGLQGDAGPAGPQGEVGSQGPQGDAGPAGPQGEVGPQGPQGEMGPAGLDGAVGPQGEVGPQGPQGEMGPAGLDGAVGPQGDMGPAGPQGDAGPQGEVGPQGPQGEQGPAGADGADGTSGSLLGGNYPNTGDDNFLSPFNPSTGSEENTNLPVSSGRARKLMVDIGAALDGGSSVTLTVRKNGVDSGLTCTVAAGESTCSNVVDEAVFADGDLLSVRYNESGNPNSRPRFTILYEAP